MLKISKLADYAIHIIHALIPFETYVSAAVIAKLTKVPEPTVSKILKKLADGHLLLSVQGPKGGYQLAKSAEKISLAELITIMDGKPAMTECCKIKYTCAQDHLCGQQSNWRMINQMVLDVLQSVSLQEMKDKSISGKVGVGVGV